MRSKRKNTKVGKAPPLRKAYLYWLMFGITMLVVMQGRNFLRTVESKWIRAKVRRPDAATGMIRADGVQASPRALIKTANELLRVSTTASNQLIVVRYMTSAGHNREQDADQILSWIPRVVAIYREGPQDWRVRTANGVNCRKGGPIPSERHGGLYVEDIDDRSVLLCLAPDLDRPHPRSSLPVRRIKTVAGERVLVVFAEGKEKHVCSGDHIYLDGWDFEIRMIASDRFEMIVRPLGSEEGRVLMYQFVFR